MRKKSRESSPDRAARPAYSTEAQRRRAVLHRDPDADDRFVFSVKTTGVYCRPSCSAKRARPENIAFHDTCDAAESAGFRACLRCRPRDDARAQRNDDIVSMACRLIAASAGEPSLDDLARLAGTSPSHFRRLFESVVGVTPKSWAMAEKDARFRRTLESSPSVTAAIHRSGYGSTSRLYERAVRVLGMTPTAYREGGRGERLVFSIGDSSLGRVLVAGTVRGLCVIAFGDDDDALRADLERRFPAAELVAADAAFDRVVKRVLEAVERPSKRVDLPLDLRGTAFQIRVWNALSAIPSGERRTYSELAGAIGAPKSTRAVAAACAANNLAVAIPCHRVVRSDSNLAGYRWGVARKAALLEKESSSGKRVKRIETPEVRRGRT